MSKNCTSIPDIIKSNAYLKGSCVSDGEHLISDIFELSNLLKLNRILLTVDIERAFNFENHIFFKLVLENYGFSQNFLKWISILDIDNFAPK